MKPSRTNSREHTIFIKQQKLESLNDRQRSVIDMLAAMGYSIQTEI